MESSTDSSVRPPTAQAGVIIPSGAQVTVGGDLVGGSKVVGYSAEQVRVLLAQISSSYQPKPFDGQSPYIGLASFQEEDAHRFFGRERIVAELVAHVASSRFLVIAGPSGSGKSSVARAGLMHALKTGALPGSGDWCYETLMPGRHPLSELGRVVASLAGQSHAADEITAPGSADPTLLHRWAEIGLGDQPSRRAVLLIDQFEEAFTQATDEAERRAFFNLLTYAVGVPEGRVTVICTTRSDFIGSWSAYPDLNARLAAGILQVGPMQDDELVSAIARPALQVGLRLDPELVEQILADMRDAPGALPLMQFALHDLFQYEASRGGVIALTREGYLARGGLQKALARHADAEFARLSPDEQQIGRTVFAGLVEPRPGAADTRRTALFQELVPAGASSSQVEKVIEKLADARLITTAEVNRRETVSLAHEQLINAWPWLHRLVEENRERIALQNQIAEDAQEWEQHNREPSYLYIGARLATVREQLAGHKLTQSALTQEFVDASIAARIAEQKQAQQRTRRLIAAFASAALLFALLAALAFILQQRALQSEAQASIAQATAESRRVEAEAAQSTAEARRLEAEAARGTAEARRLEAGAAQATAEARRLEAETRQAEALAGRSEAQRQQNIAHARELAARSIAQLNVDPERGILLALESLGLAPTHEGTDGLHQALFNSLIRNTLRAHTGVVWHVEYRPDGRYMVSSSGDDTARVWDGATGQLLYTLVGHTDNVSSAFFSPNGKYILTVSDDATARLWDTATGALIHILRGHAGPVQSGTFSPDSLQILTAGSDHSVRVWDAVTGTLLKTLTGPTGELYVVRVSPDGRRIVAAGQDAVVYIWDRATYDLLSQLRGHTRPIRSAILSADGALVATASDDGTTRVWQFPSGALLATFDHGNSVFVSNLTFSPDGRSLLTVGSDSSPRVWDVPASPVSAPAAPRLILRGHTNWVWSGVYSRDGRYILTGSDDGTARIWDAASGQELAVLRGHEASINSASFSPDDQQIVTAGRDRTIRIWSMLPKRESLALVGHTGTVFASNYSPDGQWIVTSSYDKTVRVWSAADGNPGLILRLHAGTVWNAQFSPDSKRIVTASEDGTAQIWTPATGKTVPLRPRAGQLWTAVFSPSGSTVATGTEDGLIRLWHSDGERVPGTFDPDGGPVFSLAFSPEGASLASGTQDGLIHLWDVQTGASLRELTGHSDVVYGLSYSPDGATLVSASYDHTARVWDVATGRERLVLRGHTNWVSSATYSPDGKHILTAGRDNTVRLWDAATGAEELVLQTGPVSSAAFAPDGKHIAVAGADGVAEIYVIDEAELVALARTRVTRDLSCEERVQFLQEPSACPTPASQPTP